MEIPIRLRTLIQKDREAVEAAQEKLKKPNGRYIQQSRISSQAIGVTGRPSREVKTLTKTAPLSPMSLYERKVSQYQGPKGNGYRIMYFWTENRRKYSVYYNYGPEQWRESPPQEILTNS